MQDGTIGRRYARALAQALGEADQEKDYASWAQNTEALARIEKELSALSELYAERGPFREAMRNPAFRVEERLAILDEIARVHGFQGNTLRLLRLLVQRGRFQYLSSIAGAFREEVDEQIGQVRAQITAAQPIEKDVLAQIVSALEKKTGKTVLPEVRQDASLISGMTARIGGLVFDGTVKSRLERMKGQLSV
jgi:F-type H+-transporting ATPase subunit delta